jgi:DNA-binding MarR family transcriptional regulator
MSDRPYDANEIRLEASLGYYLSKARNVLAERMDRAVEPLGLTSSQIGVILLLSCGRAHTPYELSRAMSYDSGSMTRMLDRLEKKGFIARSRSDADRRMIELKLTPQGKDAAKVLPGIGATVLNEQLRGFSGADLATLIDLLNRFIANRPGGDPAAGDPGCGLAERAEPQPASKDK